MNSSTSISKPLTWRRWLCRYLVACLLLAAAMVGVQVAIDPYDTGRFALFGDKYGVPPFGSRLSSASLARQPSTEAAMIGNSTMQALRPDRLATLTGLRFVSLSLPATGPIEQLAVAHWLVRHHDGKSANPLAVLLIDVDTRWCRGDGTIELTNPFPYWLYADSDFDYIANLVTLGTFGAVGKKLRLMLGRSEPLRGDGFHEYDNEWRWNTAWDLQSGTEHYELFGQNFAGVDRLKRFLPEVPAETLVILYHPPRYYASLPVPDSELAADQASCKAAYREAAATRPRTIVLDFLKDDPLLHHDNLFLDRSHYLRPVAEKIEDSIAETVRTGKAVARLSDAGS